MNSTIELHTSFGIKSFMYGILRMNIISMIQLDNKVVLILWLIYVFRTSKDYTTPCYYLQYTFPAALALAYVGYFLA